MRAGVLRRPASRRIAFTASRSSRDLSRSLAAGFGTDILTHLAMSPAFTQASLEGHSEGFEVYRAGRDQNGDRPAGVLRGSRGLSTELQEFEDRLPEGLHPHNARVRLQSRRAATPRILPASRHRKHGQSGGSDRRQTTARGPRQSASRHRSRPVPARPRVKAASLHTLRVSRWRDPPPASAARGSAHSIDSARFACNPDSTRSLSVGTAAVVPELFRVRAREPDVVTVDREPLETPSRHDLG